jgi:hypothetical protein
MSTLIREGAICDSEGHEFNFGVCIDCEHVDADYDPTPHGAELVTDWADSPSYKGLEQAA